MGTCTDWHSSILSALDSKPPLADPHSFAMAWRAGFFQEIHRRFQVGDDPEDIDVTHRRVLDRILSERNVGMEFWDEETRNDLVRSWHIQQAWPDAVKGLERLRNKFFVIVLANGTTRLQLDIIKSSRLPFHTLLSSQLLNLTKPDPKIYQKAINFLDLKPEECLMVASHAYDLRAAARTGMKTAYIHRSTEDPEEDIDHLRQTFDFFVEGTDGSDISGLVKLANILQT
ncbi:haloacid dehalogenase [Guyanagaster necrorhizus]|uniref:Haloacid dehalogenase n=1 Tax=Guyanagaster necrorhizus TaxID=856835 RepID=A0A9P8AQF7_9AGAR|nr:haloacid dehalogenase [Guyanagaster necrorhizus MCA 3950]KAG7442822.1 haloacid dehalogenase [Guyanagaster necrorhizus MCA 3950]